MTATAIAPTATVHAHALPSDAATEMIIHGTVAIDLVTAGKMIGVTGETIGETFEGMSVVVIHATTDVTGLETVVVLDLQ